MGVTINNESTRTESPPVNGLQSKPIVGRGGGLKCILLVQIFALDYAVVEAQKILSWHGDFLTIAIYLLMLAF